MHKITIRKKDYKRPKRLFFKGQKERLHPHEAFEQTSTSNVQYDSTDASKIDEISKQNHAFEQSKIKEANHDEVHLDIDNENVDEPINDEIVAKEQDSDFTAVETNKQNITVQEEPILKENTVHQASTEAPVQKQKTQEPNNQYNEHSNHYHEEHKNKSKKGSLWSVALFSLLLGTLIGILLFSYFYKGDQVNGEVSTEQAIQKAKKYVVSVVNLQKANKVVRKDAKQNPEEAGIGSGVIYKVKDDKAYIVTNHHVIGNANKIEVTTSNGKKSYAKVVGSDMWTDLAVITIPKDKFSNGLKFSDSDKTVVGQSAIAIGSPLGEMFAGSVSQGIISGLHRSVPVDIDGDEVYDWEMNVIQTDAAINPGNSGGALINQSGELIGINSMKITMDGVEGIGFSIPSNEVQKFIKVLERDHGIKRPKLGLLLEDLNVTSLQTTLPNNVTEGVVITDVEPNAISEAAGLRQSDVIVALDDKKIKSRIEFRKYMFNEKKMGDSVEVTFYRGQTKNKVKMQLK